MNYEKQFIRETVTEVNYYSSHSYPSLSSVVYLLHVNVSSSSKSKQLKIHLTFQKNNQACTISKTTKHQTFKKQSLLQTIQNTTIHPYSYFIIYKILHNIPTTHLLYFILSNIKSNKILLLSSPPHLQKLKNSLQDKYYLTTTMISQLPLRQKGKYHENFKKINLTSNHYSVTLKNLNTIFLYKVTFDPKLEENDRLRRNNIYMKCNDRISQEIQMPVFSGSSIYTTTKPSWGDQKTIELEYLEKKITMHLKLIKTIDFTDKSQDKSLMQLSFLNNLLRTFVKKMNYIEIGKSRRFFEKKGIRNNQCNVKIFEGFSANFCKVESGLYLKVDNAFKVVRTETALDFIDNIFAQHKHEDKQRRREIIKQSLIGQTVMTNYGNSSYWRVEGVVFDQLGEQLNLGNERMTLIQYYMQKYSIKIETKNQPLLQSKNRANERVLIVPELCFMTGLPADIDARKRRSISEQTIVPPSQKIKRLNQFRKQLSTTFEGLNIKEMEKKLGIFLDNDLAKIQAFQIDLPPLELGKNNTVDKGRQSSFMLFDKPIFDSSQKLRCCALSFSQFDFSSARRVFESTSKCINLSLEIKHVDLGNFSGHRAQDTIMQSIEKYARRKDHNIFLIILPSKMSNVYPKLKELCCCELGIVSQMMLDTVMQKKESKSVLTKVLLQMAAKVGNTLWVPRCKVAQKNKIMLIGINTSSDKQKKKKRIGFCYSTNNDLTIFNSDTQTQDLSNPIIEDMNSIIVSSIKGYLYTNKVLPSEVILLRDGCSAGQINTIKQLEVQSCISALKQFESRIKFTFVIIDKKPTQKFFQEVEGRIWNPQAGTLINSQMVSSENEFYLLSQGKGKGSSVPTFFSVLYSDSSFQKGMLQDLMYSQCYNYANWTGSIKVPSPIQYAKKLCDFVSTNLKNEATSGLRGLFYYI